MWLGIPPGGTLATKGFDIKGTTDVLNQRDCILEAQGLDMQAVL